MEDLPAEHYIALENAEHMSDDGQEAPYQEGMGRRKFLRLALGAGAVMGATYAGLKIDTKIGQLRYGDDGPQIDVIPDTEAEAKFPRHFNLVLGGFGVYNIEGLAQAVHPGLRNFGQTAYVKNSNGGLYIDKLKQTSLDFLKNRGAEVVNLYGHSMAGMEAVEIGHYLLKNGVEIQSTFLDCTPERKYDVRPDKLLGAEFLATVDRITEDLDISGGPGVRTVFESLSRVMQGRTDWKQIIKEAIAKTSPQNCSDRLLEDQADYICAYDGAEFGHAYAKSTMIAKLRPQDWDADQTINNKTALVGWQADAFPQTNVHDVPIPGGSHANPGAAGAHYTEQIIRIGHETNLYDGVSRSRSLIRPI